MTIGQPYWLEFLLAFENKCIYCKQLSMDIHIVLVFSFSEKRLLINFLWIYSIFKLFNLWLSSLYFYLSLLQYTVFHVFQIYFLIIEIFNQYLIFLLVSYLNQFIANLFQLFVFFRSLFVKVNKSKFFPVEIHA